MENKDLFDAIHNVDENYIANAWENTESDRPIVLRPEARSPKRALRSIVLGVGGTAAAAALGFAVFAGANGWSLKPIISENPADSVNDSTEFDPNAPLPIEIVAPDGKLLTYNDLVGADIGEEYNLWETEATAEEIAQMDDLFNNFDEIISAEYFKGFHCSGFIYLPEPGLDKLKRYNDGDEYCGMKILHASASFDVNKQYSYGHVFFDSEIIINDVEVILTPPKWDNGTAYYCTTADPSLVALTGDSSSTEISGSLGSFMELPENTPLKVSLRMSGMGYEVGKTPSVGFSADIRAVEPFNDTLKQWTEKDLVRPSAALPDDFNFISMKNMIKEVGTEIYAVDDGEVVLADEDSVGIKHGEDLYTTYYFIDSVVGLGDSVKAGQLIGIANLFGDGHPEADYRFTQTLDNISVLGWVRPSNKE